MYLQKITPTPTPTREFPWEKQFI